MKKKIMFFSILVVLCLTHLAHATTISYNLTNLGGGTWEYLYTVSNDTLSSDIEEFTIYLPYSMYDNLNVTSPVADWDELTVNPQLILGVPEDGFYDALSLVSGIAPGSAMGGFSVSFDWLGSGTPGSQNFEIIDPLTFDVLDSGVTTSASSTVPEPGTLMLLGSGVIGILGFRRKIMN